MKRQYLGKGHFYYVQGEGVCECVLINPTRARLKPVRTQHVQIGEREFEARGRAFDVSPTSPLREVALPEGSERDEDDS